MTKKDDVFKINKDLYPTSGDVDISFYQELYRYKSIEDYLKSKKRKEKKKRKKRKTSLAYISGEYLGIPTSPEGFNPVGMNGGVTPVPSFYDENVGNLNYGVGKNRHEEEDIANYYLDRDDKILSPSDGLYGIPGLTMPDDIDDTDYNLYERLNDLGLRTTETSTNIYDGAPYPNKEY